MFKKLIAIIVTILPFGASNCDLENSIQCSRIQRVRNEYHYFCLFSEECYFSLGLNRPPPPSFPPPSPPPSFPPPSFPPSFPPRTPPSCPPERPPLSPPSSPPSVPDFFTNCGSCFDKISEIAETGYFGSDGEFNSGN